MTYELYSYNTFYIGVMMKDVKKIPFLSILGTFELIILLVLKHFENDALTTTQISEMIKKSSNKQVSLASLYVTLSRLKKKGYIETMGMTSLRDMQGGKKRNTYQITDIGKRAVRDSYFETIQPLVRDLHQISLPSAA